jgi:hypothetical protein
MFLLEDGATPQQVDAALEAFGMAMGPFRMSDLAGNDVGWKIRQRRYVEKPHVTYRAWPDRPVRARPLRPEDGAGWYRYEAGARTPLPDPEVDALIAAYRDEIGVTPRAGDGRRDRRALRARTRQRRARACSTTGSRCAHPTSTSCTWPATAFRATAEARCSTPTRWGCGTSSARWARIAALATADGRVLEAAPRLTASPPRAARSTAEDLHARRVVVSTARTGLAKSVARRVQHDRTARRWARTVVGHMPCCARGSIRPRSTTC